MKLFAICGIISFLLFEVVIGWPFHKDNNRRKNDSSGEDR